MTATSPFLPATADNGRRWWDAISFPLGETQLDMLLVSDGDALVGVRFGPQYPGPHSPLDGWKRDPVPVADAADQLRAYATGELTDFDVPLRVRGTDFQMQVWTILLEIPYGTTTTYGRIADALGRPNGSRAVGAAVGSNPLGIIVPCHRVVGANGSLTGYGGGLPNKVALLRLEGVTAV
jgi:methylated-DNA-[protein]-cysteine S-methyltransferase